MFYVTLRHEFYCKELKSRGVHIFLFLRWVECSEPRRNSVVFLCVNNSVHGTIARRSLLPVFRGISPLFLHVSNEGQSYYLVRSLHLCYFI